MLDAQKEDLKIPSYPKIQRASAAQYSAVNGRLRRFLSTKCDAAAAKFNLSSSHVPHLSLISQAN